MIKPTVPQDQRNKNTLPLNEGPVCKKREILYLSISKSIIKLFLMRSVNRHSDHHHSFGAVLHIHKLKVKPLKYIRQKEKKVNVQLFILQTEGTSTRPNPYEKSTSALCRPTIRPFFPLVCVNIYSNINYKIENRAIMCDTIQIQNELNSINNSTPLLEGSKKDRKSLKISENCTTWP